DGQRPLGRLLPDNVLLEEVEDLPGLGQLDHADLGGLGELLLDDLVAQLDALVTDVDARPGDELLDLLLALAAERALEKVGAVPDPCHGAPLPGGRPGGACVTTSEPFHTTPGGVSAARAARRVTGPARAPRNPSADDGPR